MFDVQQSIKAQKKYCEEKQFPHFAPASGSCWSCGRNIYSPIEKAGWNGKTYTTGITVEKAGSELVTGCPHCNRSYCD
ncbi:hypothetical protein ACM1RC_25950 [Paenibacillus azoreducens]|uniref:hypothetical protein n=1 Tax=Paenibacillus azoreducens TaxID=116718 RepID=UPI0039F60029